jgi:hypothetical protein
MVDSIISLLVTSLYILLPNNNISERWLSGRTDMSLLRMPDMVLSREALGVVKRGHRARKCSEVSSSVSQRRLGEGQFRKPWLNL